MEEKQKSTLRKRADKIKSLRCKNLIAVLENPMDIINIATVVRNVNALGVEKLYVVDPRGSLPKDWEEMRKLSSLSKKSVSAIKWTFVKTFKTTEDCLNHLEKKGFVSAVTSPHIKGKNNVILHEGDYTQSKLAVWFGSESQGISDTVVERSIFCINIPMCGIIESLNLATSTGIVLYEVAKQRREYQDTHKRTNHKQPKK